MKLLSSFSFSMITEYPVNIKAEELSVGEVKDLIEKNFIEFKIGHPSFANVLSQLLGVKVEAEREKILLGKNEKAIIAQLYGAQRFPEGKVLSEDEIKLLDIRFIKVSIF